MTDHTPPPNVHQRLADAMGRVKYIQKERKQGMKYTIVSHDSVTALVRPALLEAGVVYYPVNLEHSREGNRVTVALTVRFVNIDNPPDFFDVPSLGEGIDQQDKGPGKAISYAMKYALLKAMGLETGDDPENNDIDHGPDPVAVAAQAEAEKAAAKAAAIVDEVNDNRAAAVIAGFAACSTLDQLSAEWSLAGDLQRRGDVTAAKDARKAALQGDGAEMLGAG